MNIVVTKTHGNFYLCDFRNDLDKINLELSNSECSETITELRETFESDLSDESWNKYTIFILKVLEDFGHDILWDH